MFSLRPYQKEVVRNCYSLIRKGIKRILIFAPTGAGKTVIIARIVKDAVSRDRQVLFVVHRQILISQTYQKLSSLELECGFIKAGWKENRTANVQIASVQTLASRQWWHQLQFDLIIFDEAHLTAFNAISQQMLSSLFPNVLSLGLSATPWRLSKKESLGDIFEGLVCAPMPGELIKMSYLAKPSYYSLGFQVDLADIDLVNGDYNPSQLSGVCDRPELIEQLVKAWYELAYGCPTLVFTVNVAHAENVAKVFNEHGVSAAAVTGKTPLAERDRLYERLAKGEISLIAACNALSEGFNVPEVSCIILARPTTSKALYMQQVGRGTRDAPHKRGCIVLDQSGNVLKHGFIEDVTFEDVRLIKSELKQTQAEGLPPPLKICPTDRGGCGQYVYASCRKCSHCGFSFEVDKLITVLGSDRLIRPQDEIKLNFYRAKLKEAFQKYFAPGWAAYEFEKEFGYKPPFDWARGAVFDYQTDKISAYKAHLIQTASKLNKDQNWIDANLRLEFGKEVL